MNKTNNSTTMSSTLIIDAGATKTAFALVEDRSVVCTYKGAGINPNYCSDDAINKVLSSFMTQNKVSHVSHVHYYGAGCASAENAGRIGCLLQDFYPDAVVSVCSDLMAVCRALSNNKSSIVAILGTGAATCQFDGRSVVARAPSLGYMLGDEGSGTYLGKQLVTAFMRNELPASLSAELRKQYNLSFDKAIRRIYSEPSPNLFFSSLAPFVSQHLDDPFVLQMATESFRRFFAVQKVCYEESETLPWMLSGAVAFNFREVVQAAAAEENCHVQTIVESPMESLVRYHF